MLRRFPFNSIITTNQFSSLLKNLPKPKQHHRMASTSTPESLLAAITAQGDIVRTLKAEKADSTLISEAIAKLQALKVQDGNATASNLGGKPKKAAKFTLKTPKGTKDWHPQDMALRQTIFRKITEVFELHGGVTIDTPVFELKEILSGKYGEDSKLIYDLQDQGGELCSLRYDLTVPFARFLAMYGSQYPSIKRYHIAKVYRRDQPVMTKGRMREFYQCDFDIAGKFDAMVPDAEILAIVCEVLTSLEIGDFTVKINHRKILDGLFQVCGVPTDKIRSISSAVDKLDKMSWENVRKEMVEEKGLEGAVADKIGEYVKRKGGVDLVESLKFDPALLANKTASEGIESMALLFTYLGAFGVADKMSFDLSLARGLDYYTGIIYEAVTEGSAPPSTITSLPTPTTAPLPPKIKSKNGSTEEQEVDESTVGVGSIAAGGRYDELVGMFSGNTSAAGQIPCVGISFGVERLFSLLLAKAKAKGVESSSGKSTQVFVLSMQAGMLKERMEVCRQLWAAGIKAEFAYKLNPKPRQAFEIMEKEQIPYAVMLNPTDFEAGRVVIKPQVGGKDAAEPQETVERSEMINWLKDKLSIV